MNMLRMYTNMCRCQRINGQLSNKFRAQTHGRLNMSDKDE